MSMKVVLVPFRWSHFDLCDFLKIILVVQAIAQNVAKVPKRSFQSICGCLLLGLFECCGFALAVLDLSIPNVLKEFSNSSDMSF